VLAIGFDMLDRAGESSDVTIAICDADCDGVTDES
jgi:hypothetical protein